MISFERYLAEETAALRNTLEQAVEDYFCKLREIEGMADSPERAALHVEMDRLANIIDPLRKKVKMNTFISEGVSQEFLTEDQQKMMDLRKRIVELKRNAARSPTARAELEKAEEHLSTLMKTSTL